MKKKTKTRRNNVDDQSWTSNLEKNIVEVHIASNGIFTICKAIKNDGSIAYYNWDVAADREFVRNSITADTLILVDDNVKKGWDYRG